MPFEYFLSLALLHTNRNMHIHKLLNELLSNLIDQVEKGVRAKAAGKKMVCLSSFPLLCI